MLCDKCGKRPATVHYQQVVNGAVSAQHLCSQCATGAAWGFGELDFNKLFSSAVRSERKSAVCPQCGMSLAEFQQSGRMGCAACYAAFSEALQPLIKRYHGERRHRGKIKRPVKFVSGGSEPLSPPDGLLANKIYEKLALQKQLAELVEMEKFEEAAQVRDRLRAVESEIAGHTADTSGKAGEGND